MTVSQFTVARRATAKASFVLAIVTGLEVYHLALLRGMLDVFSRSGVPLWAFANYVRYHDDAGVDGGEVVPPSLMCLLEQHRPRGVIMTCALSAEQGSALQTALSSLAIPTVYIAQDVPGESCVRADNVDAMRRLMAHLLDDCGARRPAMIRGYAHQPDHVVRERVFREEIARRGLELHEDCFADGQCEREVARLGMRQILARRPDIDAVVTTDDWCANAALEVLAETGRRVPEDVVVSGFDNYPIAALSWPGITTIDQDLELQGAIAARMLLDTEPEPAPKQFRLTRCRLVTRGSTRNAARERSLSPSLEGEMDAPSTLESIARLAQSHITSHNAVRRTSRALSSCRTVEAVVATLASSLPMLGIERCFLVLYVGNDSPPAVAARHQTAKLVLDFRDGTSHSVPDATFSSSELLPAHLVGELAKGFLGHQILTVNSGELGYLLVEYPMGYVACAEALRIDVGHCLEAIFNTNALQAHSEMLEELVKRRTAELEAEVAVRKRAEHDLQRALATDALTQIANRRAFQSYFEEQWRECIDTHELALIMIDVDLFKHYNDHYGHLKGDRALREVASCLKRAVRYPEDMASRFGGEEFTVLLPRTGEEGALIVARRFRALLAQAAIPHAASTVAARVTASIGVAVLTPTATQSPDVLLGTADAALYRAKERGRDQIVVGNVAEHRASASIRCPRERQKSVVP